MRSDSLYIEQMGPQGDKECYWDGTYACRYCAWLFLSALIYPLLDTPRIISQSSQNHLLYNRSACYFGSDTSWHGGLFPLCRTISFASFSARFFECFSFSLLLRVGLDLDCEDYAVLRCAAISSLGVLRWAGKQDGVQYFVRCNSNNRRSLSRYVFEILGLLDRPAWW